MPPVVSLPPGQRAGIAPLLGAYAAEMAGHLAGEHPAQGAAIATMLDADPRAEVLVAGETLGFAIVFDLPEAVFARRCGALDDLYVRPEARGQGVARALIAAAADLGRARGWSHLRWIVPKGDSAAIALYEKVAVRTDWRSYVIRLDPRGSL